MNEDHVRPQILYSYSAGGDWLPQCLAGNSLKFSSRLDFNDPYDCRPAYKVNRGQEGRSFIHSRLKKYTKMSPARRIQEANTIYQRSRVERLFGQHGEPDFLDEIGLMCLTQSWDEPLFWAHYAAKHSGICIGFRTDRDVFQLATKVNYQTDLPVIMRPQDDLDQMVSKTFLTKSKAWEHEKEWRIIKQKYSDLQKKSDELMKSQLTPEQFRLLADHRGAAVYQFDPTAIESITMGLLISPKQEAFVIDSVQNSPNTIRLFKAVKDDVKYKLIRKPVMIKV
jgi:hypothetical protein